MGKKPYTQCVAYRQYFAALTIMFQKVDKIKTEKENHNFTAEQLHCLL